MNNELVEFEMKNIVLFTLVRSKMKYLGINLTKYIYTWLVWGKLKLWNNDIRDVSKWRHIPYSSVGRTNIFKMSLLPNYICKFNTTSIKILVSYSTDISKQTLLYIWKAKDWEQPTQYWRKRTKLDNGTTWF